MTLRLRNVQLDVPADGYDEAVGFWAAALGATTRAGEGPYTHLVGPRSPVGVHLQRLGDGDQRIHLDLDTDDVDAEVERLVELGAAWAWDDPDGPVLTGPAGDYLCVCHSGQRQDLGSTDGPAVRLELVVHDVATELVDDVAAFWAAALGVDAKPLDPPFDPYRYLAGVAVPGGQMGMLVQDIGPGASTRIHLDLHVPDPAARDAEVGRLTSLGANTRDRTHHWVVMSDPAGAVFCVVPDRKDDA